MPTCPPVQADTSRTSAHTPASLEDRAEVASGAQKGKGRDNSAAAVPPGFHIQIGDRIALDWWESPWHGKVGVVQKLNVEAGEVDALFDGINHPLTFPIVRLVPAQDATVVPESAVEVPVAVQTTPVPADADLTAALVEEICQLAIANNCRLEEAEKAEMDTFTPKQLAVVLGNFQRQLTQHSYSACHNMRQRFQFSLRLGRYCKRE